MIISIRHYRMTMYEEEDNAFMHLQRSTDGRNWKALHSLKLHHHVGNHDYEHEDLLPTAGTYFYRLELVNHAGQKTYSKICSVEFMAESKTKLYPNPASSMITITNIDLRDKISILAVDGRKMALPYSYINGAVMINVKSLHKGLYFVHAGNKIFSVVKAD